MSAPRRPAPAARSRRSGSGGTRSDHGLPSRRAALAALGAVGDGAWSNLAVPAAVRDLPDERDRAFASHLAYDTLRWQGTLDWALGGIVERPLSEVEPALLRVLRLGALQLLRTDVPERAVVHTAVALARQTVPRRRAEGAGGFVNGVLRALARRREDLPWPDAAIDPVGHLALTTAHPPWIVTDLLGRFGAERTASILHADNDPPGLTLRATGDRDALIAELRAAGVDAGPGRLPQAVRAPGADPRRLLAVADGRAVPQDEASMRVVEATGAGPGDRVLDLCAGPGGKSTYLAQLVAPEGRVVAVERHPHRATLIRDAAARVGVEVEVHVADATRPPLPGVGPYDVVLVDAPCTGLGTGRRRPEVRWRRDPEDTAELATLQRELVAVAAGQVRPGGTLTYSVCTWTAEETAAVAATVDAREDAFQPLGRTQLLPDSDDTDGMYLATWRRMWGKPGEDSDGR